MYYRYHRETSRADSDGGVPTQRERAGWPRNAEGERNVTSVNSSVDVGRLFEAEIHVVDGGQLSSDERANDEFAR
jgi:hypothetical protein